MPLVTEEMAEIAEFVSVFNSAANALSINAQFYMQVAVWLKLEQIYTLLEEQQTANEENSNARSTTEPTTPGIAEEHDDEFGYTGPHNTPDDTTEHERSVPSDPSPVHRLDNDVGLQKLSKKVLP